MFKKLAETKQNLDQLKKIKKAVEKLVVHSKNASFECSINSNFELIHFACFDEIKINNVVIKNDILSDYVCDVVNRCIEGMKKQIQEKTSEILSGK